MERWLLTFISGAILSLFLPTVPALFLIIVTFIFGLILFSINKFRFISGLLFGAAFIWWQANNHFSVLETNNLHGIGFFTNAIELQGKIQTLVNNDATDKRFTLAVHTINQKRLTVPFHIRLTWYRADKALYQGQQVHLKARLKPAHGFANPGSFSYQRWLLSHAIVAKGYVQQGDFEANRTDHATISYSQRILEALKRIIDDPQVRPLMLALALGYRQEFETEHWQVLQNTGTAHLMAISGLHLGIVATLGYWLGRAFLFLLPIKVFYQRWVFFVPIGCSILLALTYGQLSNFSTPTIRAMIMLVLFWGIRLSHGKVNMLRWALLGIFLVIVQSPFSLISTSFWLSFCALFSILVLVFWALQTSGNGWLARVWLFIKLQFALSLLLIPVNLLLFAQSPLLPWLANVWILPWFSLLLMPMLLLMTLLALVSETLSLWLAKLCTWQLSFIWEQLIWLSDLEFSVLHSSDFLLILGFCCSLLFISYLLQQSTIVKMRLTGCFVVIILFIGLYQGSLGQELKKHSMSDWTINVLDIGHGLSVVIERNGRAMVYDTGASYGRGQSLAQSVVHPFLRTQGLANPDYLVVSHSDNDHAGGLSYFLKQLPPEKLVANIRAKELLGQHHPRQGTELIINPCLQNSMWEWQQLTVTVLWPKEWRWQENEDSCVLLVTDGRHNLLLTGDIPSAVETTLIPRLKGINIDILIAPHHGSKSSSSQAFIDAIRPQQVIFSTGYLNRWNMPSDTVTSRYQNVGARMHNTADSGMIKMTVTDQKVFVSHYRQQMAPLWFYNQFATLAGDHSRTKGLSKSW
ncbi:DNA internalization-related competence protein ComEC/Rec2 [Thalassotalea litorea]|uniref:DNA internalization-related competence protein ComEC/Rec2 n=1 Tax=Thalassotalea litorea TaxID=2020715 RepID=A0A5R9IT03_9GAMM|nr:DNA internalization-related competence protein ComEC/Rec2 [Thalassotalea litorea]TLU67623.1 DNA internalization-related competence protein ComEC/Rec2 [Thalassotalea litorea]